MSVFSNRDREIIAERRADHIIHMLTQILAAVEKPSPHDEEFTFGFIPVGLDVDRDPGTDPDEPLPEVTVDRQPSTRVAHRLLDLVGQGFELLDRALDHLPATDEDLGHDSSSPLSEGAATPDDNSVERKASAAPSASSPDGAAREAGGNR